MKIKLTHPEYYPEFTGIAKRVRDMSEEEIKDSICNLSSWDGDEVFIQHSPEHPNGLMYLTMFEYEVIEE